MGNVIQVLKPYFRVDEVLEEIRQCLEKGWTGIGFKTVDFEKQWSEYTGFAHSHFVNSATAGLHLAVKLLKKKHGWLNGDEIITPSLTFVSTNHAILYEGLTPRFCEVDKTLCLDPQAVRAAIGENTRAIMYVGLGGNAAHYRAMRGLADEFGLMLILDAAHMAGTRWLNSGEHVGLDADCTIFSFQAVKNCPSSDSGMICFRDEDLDREVRLQSWLGIDKSTYDRYTETTYKWRYDVTDLGYKYNGNAITAAIGLVSLKYLDEDNARRRQMAQKYEELLKNCADVTVIRHDPKISSSRHLIQILVEGRDHLMDWLATQGIYCGVHYIPNHRYGVYNKGTSELPVTDHVADRLISLPLHLWLSDDDVEHVASSVEAFFSRSGK